MRFSTLLFATLLALPQSFAQQPADGVLVPFVSTLPSCAWQCGPLHDVQGGCADVTCFCADARLQAFRQTGTAGVSAVCGVASCSAAADLERVKSWYNRFCGSTAPTATATGANSGATSGSSGSGSSATPNPNSGNNDTWFARHTRWVIFIIVVVIGLTLAWVGAWYFRRRYLRRKEREIEMSPPVAWGPNQTQSAGYQYGDGVADGNRGPTGGHHKELASAVPAHGKRLSKSKMGWFKANK